MFKFIASSPAVRDKLCDHLMISNKGVEPCAPEQKLASISRLPEAIPDLMIKNLSIENSLFSLSHFGNKKSTLTYQSGENHFTWEIRFYGEHAVIKVNGVAKPALHILLNSVKISFITEEIKPGETIAAQID